MITFAGIGLTPPDHQSPSLQWWHGYRIEEFDFPFFNASQLDFLPVPPEPRKDPPRIGVLRWPTTASRFATCHLLATADQVSQVRAQYGTDLGTGAIIPTAQTLVINDGTNSISTDMWMLPPRPIIQKGVPDLYLITLVDERWWWWQTGDQSVPESPASWTVLLTDLFTSLGISSPTIDTIPSAYGTPSAARWKIGFKPIPFVIDCVCRTVGLRVVRQLDGSVACQSYNTASTQDATNWTNFKDYFLSGGQLSVDDIALSVPESVATVFLGTTSVAVTTSLSSLTLTQYGQAAGTPGWAGQVIADLDSTASTSQQDQYATQATTDYYLWALAVTDGTMRDIRNRPLTGLDDFQEWVHSPDQVVTRVARTVFSDRNLYGGQNPGSEPPAGGKCTSSCGTLVGLQDNWCLALDLVCAKGQFSTMDLTQTDGVVLFGSAGTWTAKKWDDGTASWVAFSLDYVGGTGAVTLGFTSDGTPVLHVGALTPKLLCLGANATFAGGPRNGFVGATGSGAPVVDQCDPDDFILEIHCICCPPDKWKGPGIYCVDIGDGCEPLLVDEDEMCVVIEVCSGPYATMLEAELVCGSVADAGPYVNLGVSCCNTLTPIPLNTWLKTITLHRDGSGAFSEVQCYGADLAPNTTYNFNAMVSIDRITGADTFQVFVLLDGGVIDCTTSVNYGGGYTYAGVPSGLGQQLGPCVQFTTGPTTGRVYFRFDSIQSGAEFSQYDWWYAFKLSAGPC